MDQDNHAKVIVAKRLLLEDRILEMVQSARAGALDFNVFVPVNKLDVTALKIAKEINEERNYGEKIKKAFEVTKN